MKVTRRDFIKYCLASSVALGLDLGVLGRLRQVLAGDASMPTVVWLNGANCTGCTISLANLVGTEGPADVADLLINYINLAFHPNLMGAAGDLAVEQLEAAVSGDFILVVDGGIPTAFGGHACMLWTESDGQGGRREVTALEAVGRLAPLAAHVLAVGTCAAYGGIPAAAPNPTGIVPVSQAAGVGTINIPGCPVHPDWLVSVIAQLLAGSVPPLDALGRPANLFEGDDHNVHRTCPRRGADRADAFGQPGCLMDLGCKGPRTQADCPTRQWNNHTNWCIGANALCLGCTEPGFPDNSSPFYIYSGIPDEGGNDGGGNGGGGTGDGGGHDDDDKKPKKPKKKDREDRERPEHGKKESEKNRRERSRESGRESRDGRDD